MSKSNKIVTKLMKQFLEKEILKNGLQYKDSDILFTYESMVNENWSITDHFLVSDNLFNAINRYHTLHEGDNVSDHPPVCMSLYIKKPTETSTAKITQANLFGIKHLIIIY